MTMNRHSGRRGIVLLIVVDIVAIEVHEVVLLSTSQSGKTYGLSAQHGAV